MRVEPKWARTLIGDIRCSVCEKEDCFYEKLVRWDSFEPFNGKDCRVANFSMMRYCMECFQEYGGTAELIDLQEVEDE